MVTEKEKRHAAEVAARDLRQEAYGLQEMACDTDDWHASRRLRQMAANAESRARAIEAGSASRKLRAQR